MSDAFGPALEALRQQLAREEKAAAETRKLINKLSEVAGLTPPYPETEEVATASLSSIRSDTFYGKKLFRAIREYMEMRRVGNLGPAETRDIYDALLKGGYQFEAADANNAMTGMRSLMRKNSATFHRLPNGTWGLTSWYENIKTNKANTARNNSTTDYEAEENETADIEPSAVRMLTLRQPDEA